MQYGLIDSEFIHSLWHFHDKNEESFDDIMKYHQLGSSHAIQYLSAGYKRGAISQYDEITPGVPLQNDPQTHIDSYFVI